MTWLSGITIFPFSSSSIKGICVFPRAILKQHIQRIRLRLPSRAGIGRDEPLDEARRPLIVIHEPLVLRIERVVVALQALALLAQPDALELEFRVGCGERVALADDRGEGLKVDCREGDIATMEGAVCGGHGNVGDM